MPEVIVNGGKQGGVWKAPGLVPLGWKARSKLSKLELMTAFIHLQESLSLVDSLDYPMPSRDTTYYDLKHRPNSTYRHVKSLLRGHLRPPTILSHFEKCGELHSTGCSSEDDLTCLPPFRGWIVSGEKWESFTIDGQVTMDHDEYIIPVKVEIDVETAGTPPAKVTSEGVRAESPLLVTPPAPLPRSYSDILIQGQRLSLEDKVGSTPSCDGS